MNEKSVIVKILLFPFSVIYGGIILFRNWLFDIGLLPSEKFTIPIISVGNITVGGTGKTPFTEYLIRLLQPHHKVGVLSRGYKRKTRGYMLARENSSPLEIGDEPCQIKNKFPGIMVAVDANRREGIRNMLREKNTKPDVIILDDAFQHRYVNPDISILLIDYNRLITEDCLLPLGQLREPVKAKDRAHIVVVTKCPRGIQPIDIRIITKNLKLYPYQTLYFSTFAYEEMTPVFPGEVSLDLSKNELKENYSILSLSGIASPRPFERHVRRQAKELIPLRFPDHHNFTKKDIEKMEEAFGLINNRDKIIVTTEKDAIRIKNNPNFPSSLKSKIYYIPLTIHFLFNQEKTFNKQIKEYVEKNRANMRIF